MPLTLPIPATSAIEILLVEDNADEAEMTMEVLREGRVRNRIHWVEDREEALAFLRKQGRHAAAPRLDLVLRDLHLPRLGGLAVLSEIKQHTDWQRVPVRTMTSTSAD